MGTQQALLDRLSLAEKLIFETPIVHLEDDELDLYSKLEFYNGVGSIKDRPALWILKGAIQRGEIAPGGTVVESSSGNFACALASFCHILKLNFIPVIDPVISPMYESYLQAHCKRVVKVTERDETGSGYLRNRLRMVHSLLQEIPGSYWTNQYENPDGMRAHYHLTGGEICRALPDVDYVFLGVSSAGTISGVSRRLKEHNPRVKIIAVDAVGSLIFGQTPRKRHISGIGSSIVPALLKQAVIDDVVFVPEPNTVAGCHILLDRFRLFVGGSTGTVYSAIRSYFLDHKPVRRPKVLFLSCDRGTAYLQNIYNPEWVAEHIHDYQFTPAAAS
jgi:2,3-diaminopropionate biosynthesis protein SbnA